MGFYVGKKRYFERIEELLPSFKKVCKYSFIIGVTLCVPLFLLVIHVHNAPSLLPVLLLSILQYFSGIAIGTFYVTSLVLLFKSKKFKKLTSYFGYIGRMALTNYLMQSFICVFIFYGFGLGFFGQVSLIQGTILSLAILVIQVFASKLWLTQFKYGPFEWLWRMFTYGQKIPIKLKR